MQVVKVGILKFGSQGAVLRRLPDLDGVDVEACHRSVDIVLDAVVAEIITFNDQLEVVEIDVFAMQLVLDRVGPAIQHIDFTLQRGVGVSGNVFAQWCEGDDESGKGDEDDDAGNDDDDEVQQINPEVHDGLHGLVM